MPDPDDRVIEAADGAVHDAVTDVIAASDGREFDAVAGENDDDHLRAGRSVPAQMVAQSALAQAVATTTADPEASTQHDAVAHPAPVKSAVAETPSPEAAEATPEAPNNPYLTHDDPDPVAMDTASDADAGGSE